MEFIILKNIKYKGKFRDAGDKVDIDEEHIEEFIDKEIIHKGDYLQEDEATIEHEEVQDIPTKITEEEYREMTNPDMRQFLIDNSIEDVSDRATKEDMVKIAKDSNLIE